MTSIGYEAFEWCTSLTSVEIPDSVNEISSDAFYDCVSLVSIKIPDGVTKIGNFTFRRCSNLTSVEIPDSVTNIGYAAFRWCANLTDVYYGGTEEQWNEIFIDSDNESLTNATIHFSNTSDDESGESVTEVFEDIYAEDWYTESVQFVYDNGMMSGSDGTFKPNDNMTRAMMVTTLYRLSGSPEVKDYTATSLFSDVEAGSWYEDAVNWAYNTKVTTGYTDFNGNPTYFGSNDNVTREQLAVFLHRYAEMQGYDVTVRADITGYVGYNEISDYANDAMQWAVGVGLISGIESNVNGTTIYDLAPKGSATRAQLATILMRFCNHYDI